MRQIVMALSTEGGRSKINGSSKILLSDGGCRFATGARRGSDGGPRVARADTRLTLSTAPALSLVPPQFSHDWTRVFVSGGAGFIGSHLVTWLLRQDQISRVVIFDNFTSGKRSYIDESAKDPRVEVINADLKDVGAVTAAMAGCDT